MSKIRNIRLIPVFILPLVAGILAFVGVNKPIKANADGYNASSLPTTIDLNDASESKIRSYYASLESLDPSERKGENLLKNLKPILMNGQKYFSYDSGSAVWQYYEITDRDWYLSPASENIYGTYDASTNTITNYKYGSNSTKNNNPYLHLLYRNVGNKDGFTKAWDPHGSNGANKNGIDREHVWPKSHGFNAVMTGARGDPHHLIAGDHIINNNHSDISYGYVNKTSLSPISSLSYLDGNYKGTSLTLGSGTVFEPQDSDKGDIARACFYMVARYNNIAKNDSNISAANPNLTLSNNIVTETGTSDSEKTYSLGVLSDLLQWHHDDPVDEYEMHRNNLIYNNFGKNRNPFIDFPKWVDAIWGDQTSAASPESDDIVNPIPFDPSKYEEPDEPIDPIDPVDENVTNFVASDKGFENGENIESLEIDDFTTLTTTKNSNNNKVSYYDSGTALRAYGGCTMTFTSTRKIKTIEFVYGSGGDSNALSASTGTFNDPKWTNSDNQNAVTFTVDGTSGNRRISAIKITYEPFEIVDFTLTASSDVFKFGEGNGQVVPSFDAKGILKDGSQVDINVSSNPVNTHILGTQEVNVTYGNAVKTYPFTVTNEGTNFEMHRDMINSTNLGSSGNTYKDYSYENIGSWSINCAASYKSVQLRTNNSSSGIIQTSGPSIFCVLISWNENTSDGRKVDIYGSNAKYESIGDLYDTTKQGTLLGTLKKGEESLEISTVFKYIGIRAHSDPIYLYNINLIYESAVAITQAKAFGDFFINKTCEICSDNGVTNHFNELNDIWPYLSKEYKAMSNDVKNHFETSYDETILNARLRLEHILSRYHNLENFTSLEINRTNSIKLFDVLGINDSPTLVIVLLTFIALGSCSIIIYVIRRKKTN